MARKYRPSKLTLHWLTDASKVTIYAGGKKRITVTLFLEGAVDGCAAFMEGWFGTADRSQWKYRVTFARSKNEGASK